MDWHRCKELVQYIGVNAINCLWRSSTCLVHIVVSLCIEQKGEPIVFPHLSRRNKKIIITFCVKFENDLANLLLPPFRYSSWKWKSPPMCSYPDLCNFPERLFATQILRFHFFLVSLSWGRNHNFSQNLWSAMFVFLWMSYFGQLLWGGGGTWKCMQGFRGVSDLGFGTLDNFFFRWGGGGSFTWKCIQGFFGCLGWASKAWDYNDDNE